MLTRFAARLALVTVVTLTALCQFRGVVVGGGSSFAIHSTADGWLTRLEVPPASAGVFWPPSFEITEYDRHYLRWAYYRAQSLNMRWWGFAEERRSGSFAALVFHWVLWAPLLVLNLLLWWQHRRQRQHSQLLSNSPV